MSSLDIRRAQLLDRVDQMAASKIALLQQQLAQLSSIHTTTFKYAHAVADLVHQNDIRIARYSKEVVEELAAAVNYELVDEVGLLDSDKIPFHFNDKFILDEVMRQGCVGGPGRPVGLTAQMRDFNIIVKWNAPDPTSSNSGTGVVKVGSEDCAEGAAAPSERLGSTRGCCEMTVDSYLIQAAVHLDDPSATDFGIGRHLDFFDVAVVDAGTKEVVMDAKKYPNQYLHIRVCAINSYGAHGAHSKVVKVHTPADFSHMCVFGAPFDRQGALYWLGTSCGSEEYRNPHCTGIIIISSSSISSIIIIR
jgi:hypothetical protein